VENGVNHERHETHERKQEQNAGALENSNRMQILSFVFSWFQEPVLWFTHEENNMSITVTIEEAREKLLELVHQLGPGDELLITENNQPLAKLTSELAKSPRKQRPGPGLCKGMITIISDDDDHLKDFQEYM
jgi:antitoxin (DNA-binding transcriptional repressor) of toxin-antitoxin stability system